MQALAQLIKDAVEQYGDEEAVSFYNGYSGRGMYGRKCVGIVGSESTCKEIIAGVIKEAHLASASNDEIEFDEIVDTLLDSCRDSMGLDVILYWPEIAELPEEPEHDGQPDEAQEWHDFDPDC